MHFWYFLLSLYIVNVLQFSYRSYEGIGHAVSDSIRSSLSSEELEWQYEQYENYIPQNRPSFIQEVDSRDLDDTEDCQSEDSNVEGNILRINSSSISFISY